MTRAILFFLALNICMPSISENKTETSPKINVLDVPWDLCFLFCIKTWDNAKLCKVLLKTLFDNVHSCDKIKGKEYIWLFSNAKKVYFIMKPPYMVKVKLPISIWYYWI